MESCVCQARVQHEQRRHYGDSRGIHVEFATGARWIVAGAVGVVRPAGIKRAGMESEARVVSEVEAVVGDGSNQGAG